MLRKRVAVAGERVGVAAGVPRLDVGQRRLGDQRAQPDVLGLLLEEGQLLVGDGELGAHPLEALAHVDEAALRGSTATCAESRCALRAERGVLAPASLPALRDT